ncbi:MAG: cytochrome c peroxidase [Pseudomonadota bacterium]
MIRAGLLVALFISGVAVAGELQLPEPATDADYAGHTPELIQLGQQLFYDPILSGNRNISCATCHHPRFGTSDGLALGIGEGGIGIGPTRRLDPKNLPEQHIPRNAPALFNLGAREFTVLFHDGRIEHDPDRPSGLRTPLEDEMVQGFSSLLSAQTMFPVLSADEMAGHYSENEIAQAVRQGRLTGPDGAWDLIAKRVAAVPAYAQAFSAQGIGSVAFTDISDAVAAFMAFEWRSDDSAFDRYLRQGAALPDTAVRGMALFYGPAGCAECHTGVFQTDHRFHAMGTPQFGPGKAARFETHRRDLGRGRVTGRAQDAFAFRTPSLRNVALTAPYGHTGSHADLADFVAYHADPVVSAKTFDAETVPLIDLPGRTPLQDTDQTEVLAAVSRPPVQLTPVEIVELIAFLNALTGDTAVTGRLGVPEGVPSGLPVER